MNPQSILEQFLGPDAAKRAGGAVDSAKSSLAGSGMAGVAGGLAAGGLLGVLLGNKKARKTVGKVAGGVAGYGGAAALGALAYRAYQNWQSGQQAPQPATPSPAAAPAPVPLPAGSKFRPKTASEIWDNDSYEWNDQEWMSNRPDRVWHEEPISVFEVNK